MLLALRCPSRLAAGQVGSSRLAAGQHQVLEEVLPLRLPALKRSHCRCQYQLQASSGWLAAGLAMPFKASSRPSRQFQASSRPTPGLRGGFALAFARLETLPLPLPIPTPGLQRLACQLLAAGLAMPFKASSRPSRQFQASSRPTPALRGCPSRLAAGQVGSSRLAAGQHQLLEDALQG